MRSVRDFLRAVSTIVPEFTTHWSNDIVKSQKVGQTTPDLYELVEHFRDHQREGSIDRRLRYVTPRPGQKSGTPHDFSEPAKNTPLVKTTPVYAILG